jgi:adenosylhomocysteine nucleosidase
MRNGESSVPSRHRILVLISADAEWARAKEVLKPAHLEQSPCGEYFTHPVSGEPVLFFHGGWGKIAAAASTYTTEIDPGWLDPLPISLRTVTMVSADRDLVPSETAELVRRFEAVAADWESSAIAFVANRRNIRILIIRAVSDLVGAHGGEAIGARALFQNEAAKIMRSLLADLDVLVPHIVGRGSVST